MSTPARSDPEQAMKDGAAELEERIHKLEDHIEEAQSKVPDSAGDELSGDLPVGARSPENDEPATVEGRRDGDDEDSSA